MDHNPLQPSRPRVAPITNPRQALASIPGNASSDASQAVTTARSISLNRSRVHSTHENRSFS